MVASDRISAYDFVLDTTIPDKGEILTRMSLWWFDQLAELVAQPRGVDRRARRPSPGARSSASSSRCSRSSAWPAATSPAPGLLDYRRDRRGLRHRAARRAPGRQPAAASRSSPRPPRPTLGDHDENVDYEAVVETVGDDAAAELRMLTLAVYGKAAGARPGSAASSWPTPSSSSAAAPDGTTCSPTRCSPPTRSRFWPADRLAARPRPGVVRQADRARLADSPESGWDRDVRRGAAAAARARSSSAPGRATSRRTSC